MLGHRFDQAMMKKDSIAMEDNVKTTDGSGDNFKTQGKLHISYPIGACFCSYQLFPIALCT